MAFVRGEALVFEQGFALALSPERALLLVGRPGTHYVVGQGAIPHGSRILRDGVDAVPLEVRTALEAVRAIIK